MKYILLLFCLLFLFFCMRSIRNSSDLETIRVVDWSVRDLKRISKELSNSISESHFINYFEYKKNKSRWILAKELENYTDEDINTKIIMKKIQTQLIKNRLAKFVDDKSLNNILAEKKLQNLDLFDNRKAAKVGKLLGAKIILRGRISNIRNRIKNFNIIYYNITMQLVNLETKKIIWSDESEIQRLEKR